MNDTVDVLLATYNGSRYLSEQIESVLAQSHREIRLIIRDDGSKDYTVSIIQEFIKKDPKRVIFLPSDSNLGVRGNFSRLMEAASSPYIMFCDQDDVWLRTKVADTLDKMKEMESRYGSCPCLVHTDLSVADDSLNIISESFWDFTHLNPNCSRYLNRLLVQNVVTGCTVMMNQDLLKLARPIPQESGMHDWWAVLVAAAFGQVEFLKKATVLYRQHGQNTLGAKEFRNWHNIKLGLAKLIKGNRGTYYQQQAQIFLDRYHDLLSGYQKNMLLGYLRLGHCSWITSRYLVLKYQFFKNGFLRNFATFLLGK
jgi:glycosyltransferase involved in cell wall biosynthesis